MVGRYAVGLRQEHRTHILSTIYQCLEAASYVSVEDTSKVSASTCTNSPLSKTRRINRERRQFVIGEQVYAIVDELRLNSIINVEEIQENLANVRHSIGIIETYINIRTNPEFIKMRTHQLQIVSDILGFAARRLKFMDKLDYYKPTILSYLYREVVFMDKLTELDIKIKQFCTSFGVSGSPFAEAGKLVGRVWGVTAKSLFKEIGKE